MPKTINCTELDQTITDIAVFLAQSPQFKNEVNIIDKVAAEMEKNIPGMTRQMLVDSLAASGGFAQQNLDAIKEILGDKYLKKEARTQKDLEAILKKINEAIANEMLLPDKAEQRKESDYISKLQHYTSMMRRAYQASTPAVRQRLQADIDALESDISRFIASGEIPSNKKDKEYPAGTEDLVELRKVLRKRLAKMKKDARESPAEVALRKQESRRNKELRDIDKLQETLTELGKHLEDGTMPERIKRQVQGRSDNIERLRETRAMLRRWLRESPQAVTERRRQTLERLDAKLQSLIDGSYVKPVKPTEATNKAIEDLEYKIYRKTSEIDRRILALRPRKWTEYITEPFNLSRAILTSYDLSGVIRQGGFIVFGHPIRSAKALKPMFKAIGSHKYATRIHNEILNDPMAPLFHRAGLDITDLDSSEGLSRQEEIFMSRWLGQLPEYKTKADYAKPWKIVASGVHASQRAYVTFLNKIRVDSFKTLVSTLTQDGDATIEESRAIANFVNVATGRGNLMQIQSAAQFLNTFFFAPKYVASRFQLALGYPLWGEDARNATGRVRKAIAMEYARYAAGMFTFMSLMSLAAMGVADDDDEISVDFDGLYGSPSVRVGDHYSLTLDPRSTDFGKLVLGNARLEVMSGMGQVATLLGRAWTGDTITGKGDVKPLRKHYFGDDDGPGFTDQTMKDKLWSFLGYKLSPLTAFGLEMVSGVDAINQPVTPPESVLKLAIPISGRDIFKAYEEAGVAGGTALSLASLFGFGLNVYGDRK